MEEPIKFFEVDKISDDVFVISSNAVLKFNVALSKINGGKRYHFHKEFEYPVEGLPEVKSLATIRRTFDYYLSLENPMKDSKGNKAFIRIGPNEYFLLKKALEEVIAWFTDKKYENLFATYNGKLVLTTPTPSKRINSLPMQKYIEFIPIIIDKGIANADKEPGVRMFLSSPDNYTDFGIDRLMGFYYSVSTFNMYLTATNLINYLGRPELGTNRISLSTGGRTFTEQPEHKANSVEGRFVKGLNSNIEALENNHD